MATKSNKPMQIKDVKELLKLVKELGYAEFEFESEEFYFNLRTPEAIEREQVVYTQPTVASQPQAPQAVTPAVNESNKASTPESEEQDDTAEGIVFKAPMVGTFYRRPSPDKDPFVGVGDQVKEGDPVCIIEAMKLFNEVEYEGPAGKIIKVYVDDATPIEYDQPLFLVEPKA